MSSSKIIICIFAILAIFFGSVFAYTYFVNKPSDKAAVGDEVTIMGRNHIKVGEEHAPYTTNPPSSGPHYDTPEPWGIKSAPITDEYAVHSLEHGTVWITYLPDKISRDELKQLESIANKYRRIILSPRPANDSLVAVVSWGRIQKFNQFDADKINLFAERNRNRGPEKWTLDTPPVIWILHKIGPYLYKGEH